MFFAGSKGGGSSFKSTPDNLRSEDTFEGVLGIGLGPFKGPKNGLKSITVDGTAVENATGELNFKDFLVNFADGDPIAHPQTVQTKLGAGATPVPVNLALSNDGGNNPIWVTKTLSNLNVEFIDLRFVVQQLYRQTSKGIFNETATLEIEMKPTNSTNWINPTLNTGAAVPYNQSGYPIVQRDGWISKVFLPRIAFEISGGANYASNGQNYKVTGKTTSPSVYELRIAVPSTGNYANTSWDIRVRLLEDEDYEVGQDDDKVVEKRAIQWESLTGVYGGTLGGTDGWEGLSWLQVYGKASDQLTGIPDVEGEYETKIVATPPASYFNAETRQYQAGIWDGSWEYHFTEDPAWCVADLISDPLGGVAAFAPGSTLNKWDALEASKWWSELVPDGDGGLEPRFSMNIAITDKQKAPELVRYMAGAVGGLAWENGGGEWRLKVDKPETSVDVFTLETIVGDFSYSHTDIDTRYNDITGKFINEAMDYREDTVRLFDTTSENSIANIGRKATTIALVGCTRRQEALRRVMMRMRSATREWRMVNFVTNRRGKNINPLDTILVADSKLGNQDERTTGRIIEIAGDRMSLTVRDTMRLEDNIPYELRFSVVNPDYDPNPSTAPTHSDWLKPTVVKSLTVTNTNPQRGNVTTIYLDEALPANIAENLPVALEATGLATIPKAYRVLTMEPQDDGETVAINAVEIDVDKWAAVDGVSKTDSVYVPMRGAPDPPTLNNGTMLGLYRVELGQGANVELQAAWETPPDPRGAGTRVRYRVNDGNWIILQTSTQLNDASIVNPVPGLYEFELATVGRDGLYSSTVTESLEVTRELIDVAYADWDRVVGDDRPEDNATVGGTIGVNVDDGLGGIPNVNDLVTINGIAAGFTGQEGIATSGSWADIYDGTRPIFARDSNLLAGGYANANFLGYADGTLIQALQPAESGANVTGSNISAGILGQGTGATANSLAELDPDAGQSLSSLAITGEWSQEGASNISINGNSFSKTSGGANWRSSVHTTRLFGPGTRLTFEATPGEGYRYLGFSSSTGTMSGNEYTRMDYGFNIDGSENIRTVAGASSLISVLAANFTGPTQFALEYTDGELRYYIDDMVTPVRVVTGVTGQFVFHSTLFRIGIGFDSVNITPMAHTLVGSYYLSNGSTAASDAEIQTASGIAAGFTGQAGIATSGSWADILDGTRPIFARDSNLLAGGYANANFLGYDDGTLIQALQPAESGANVTGSNISAGFTGQAGIATSGSWADIVDGTRPIFAQDSNLLAGGYANANFLGYADGTLIQALQPAAAGADPTASNISAGILGQGTGATANTLAELDSSAAAWLNSIDQGAGRSGNLVRNGDLSEVSSDMFFFNNANSYRQNASVGDPVSSYLRFDGGGNANVYFNGATSAANNTTGVVPVKGGQKIYIRLYGRKVAGNSFIRFFGYGYTADAGGGYDYGDIALTSGYITGFNSAWGYQEIVLEVPEFAADGTTPLAGVKLGLQKISAGNIIDVGEVIMATSEPGARRDTILNDNFFLEDGNTLGTDALVVTGSGISAGFTGQASIATTGSWADIVDGTRPIFAQDSNLLVGGYANANFLGYADGTLIQALQPAAAGADPTASNISAGFTGQAPAATDTTIETSADVTKTVSGPAELILNYSNDGTLTTSLPVNGSFKLTPTGGSHYTSGVSWAVVVETGTFSGSAPTISGAGVGQLAINSGIDSPSAKLRITATYGGRAYPPITILINKVTAASSQSGGSGAGTFANDTTLDSFSSSSFVAISEELEVSTGASSTSVALTAANVSLWPNDTTTTGANNCQMKWQWYNGSSWVDVGSAVDSNPDPVVITDPEPGTNFNEAYAGSLTCNQTKTGLTASTTYKFRLMARRSTGPTRTIACFGSEASAQG